MSTERMRRLLRKLRLLEHFTMNRELNAEIERRFTTLPEPMKFYVRDAAEALHAAGSSGMTKKAWADAVKAIWPEEGPEGRSEKLSAVLGTTHRLFTDHIADHDGVMYWFDDPMPLEQRRGVMAQVALTSACIAAVRDAPQPISLEAWAEQVATARNLPVEIVQAYLQLHFIQNMGLVKQDERGNYYMEKDAQENAMDLLNKIASGEIIVPGVDPNERM